MNSITFDVPLPPTSLRANSRSHWALKKKHADVYSRAVWGWAMDALASVRGMPWPAADVHYEWHYATTQPDEGNIPGNVKYLQDILCVAPVLPMEQAAVYKRTHLGIVENDRNVHPTYSMVKETRRAAQRVVVTVTERAI